jgi:phage terminase small subunit
MIAGHQQLLTERQARFAFYLKAITGGRKQAAALLAGYSPPSAANAGTANTGNPLVKQLTKALDDVTAADVMDEYAFIGVAVQ